MSIAYILIQIPKNEMINIAWFKTNERFFSHDFLSPKLNLRGKMNPKFSSVFVFKCHLSHMSDRILTCGYKTGYLQNLLSLRASLVC